jgi:UDP-N-acetyl-D-mannosaminuronate dehydrogenase
MRDVAAEEFAGAIASGRLQASTVESDIGAYDIIFITVQNPLSKNHDPDRRLPL